MNNDQFLNCVSAAIMDVMQDDKFVVLSDRYKIGVRVQAHLDQAGFVVTQPIPEPALSKLRAAAQDETNDVPLEI